MPKNENCNTELENLKPAKLHIANMEYKHFEYILEVENLSFSRPWPEEAFVHELRNPLSVYLVALAGERAIGYAGMQTVLDEGYITNVAVHPAARRQGIGQALMRGIIAEGQRRGLAFITLEVRESNHPAKQLYKSFGFAEVGRRKNYYTNPIEDAKLYTLHLAPQNEG